MGLKKNSKSGTEVCGVSDILEKFGSYQKLQYFYVSLPAVFLTMININYVFLAGDLNYRCQVPECESSPHMYSATWWPNSTLDRCQRPVLKENYLMESACSNNSFSGAVEECTEWIYETNNTMVADLNLACQPWKTSLLGTIHNMGMLVSMVTSGWMADRYGRKPTLLFCAVGSCIGHIKTFATSYYMYAFVEFLESAISGGCYPAAMVIMIEIGGKKSRVLSGVLFAYAVYIGEMIFACIAMLVPYWKSLARIIYTPPMFLIFLIFLIRESPRWQIVNNKSDKAKETLQKAAKTNNQNIDLNNIDEAKLKEAFQILESDKMESISKIFTSREIMKRVMVSFTIRFTASFVYYGLMLNSVYLPGNKYTNFLLSTVMSFPGELLAMYAMNKIGRKPPLIIGYLVCGGLCIASGCVPERYVWVKIAFFLVGKMVISMCFTGAITYSMELFPTSVRGTLIGVCSFASRFGAMLTPLTTMLNSVSPAVPAILFGIPAVVSSLALLLTPETRDLPLMDTIQQVHDSLKTNTKTKQNDEGKDNAA